MNYNSFTRTSYDMKCQEQSVKQSRQPGLYMTNTPVKCSSCFYGNPGIINQKGNNSLNKNTPWRFYQGPVDIESQLKGINKIAGCDNNESKIIFDQESKNMYNYPSCSFPINEPTNMKDDACNRGFGVNRFQPCLYFNPQHNVIPTFPHNVNTSLMMKDNHRPCYPNTKPMFKNILPQNAINRKMPCNSHYNNCLIYNK